MWIDHSGSSRLVRTYPDVRRVMVCGTAAVPDLEPTALSPYDADSPDFIDIGKIHVHVIDVPRMYAHVCSVWSSSLRSCDIKYRQVQEEPRAHRDLSIYSSRVE